MAYGSLGRTRQQFKEFLLIRWLNSEDIDESDELAARRNRGHMQPRGRWVTTRIANGPGCLGVALTPSIGSQRSSDLRTWARWRPRLRRISPCLGRRLLAAPAQRSACEPCDTEHCQAGHHGQRDVQ